MNESEIRKIVRLLYYVLWTADVTYMRGSKRGYFECILLVFALRKTTKACQDSWSEVSSARGPNS
jgi:hypothetical protein